MTKEDLKPTKHSGFFFFSERSSETYWFTELSNKSRKKKALESVNGSANTKKLK